MAIPKAFNIPYLEQYGNAVAKKLCDLFFKKKEVITGAEILKLAPVSQVNMFVVKALLLQWQLEASRLRSPYFDFEHTQVKEAMTMFMERLSHHIAIRRGHFEPLLSKAVRETTMLVYGPTQYFDYEVHQLADRMVSVARLRDTAKFYVVNRAILDEALKELSLLRVEELFAGELKVLFYQIIKDKASLVTKPDEILSQLNQLLPIDKEMILVDEQRGPGELAKTTKTPTGSYFQQVANAVEEKQQSAPVDLKVSQPAAPVEPILPEPITIAANAVPDLTNKVPSRPAEPTKVVKEPHFELYGPPIDKSHEEGKSQEDKSQQALVAESLVDVPPRTNGTVGQKEKDESSRRTLILNEAFETHRNSLNTTIGQAEQALTIKDRIRETRIASIATAVQVGERFQYIRELFGGDEVAFLAAVQELDQVTSKQDALDLMLNQYGLNYSWDFSTSKAANNFLKLVERRFLPA
jgi:hypothetical protein